LGYPKEKEEIAILDAQRIIHPLETIDQVMSAEELLRAQSAVREIHIAESVKSYVVSVVTATRSHPDVYLGASPRGSLALSPPASSSSRTSPISCCSSPSRCRSSRGLPSRVFRSSGASGSRTRISVTRSSSRTS